jgi:hypothetical protein
LTLLGQHYGFSRVKMGQWLVTLGLRNESMKPSKKAFDGGFVDQRASTNLGTYFWVGHAAKIIRLLDESGYKRAEPKPEQPS